MGIHGIDRPKDSAKGIAIGVIVGLMAVVVLGWWAYKKLAPKKVSQNGSHQMSVVDEPKTS